MDCGPATGGVWGTSARGETVNQIFAEFLRDESAATAIEYSLILGLVALVTVAAVTALAQSVDDMYSHVSSSVIDVLPASGG